MVGDANILAMTKGKERYIFLWDDSAEQRLLLLKWLGRLASNKELSFSWYDAAVMSIRVRQVERQRKESSNGDPLLTRRLPFSIEDSEG